MMALIYTVLYSVQCSVYSRGQLQRRPSKKENNNKNNKKQKTFLYFLRMMEAILTGATWLKVG